MASKQSNKIRVIVRLQQMLKKWRKLANSSKTRTQFLKRTLSLSENSVCEASSSVVPKGFLAVCVGDELKRFIIPTEYLSRQAFHILLREAEEEFGFQQTGVLRIPCQVSVFENILKLVEERKDKFFEEERWFNGDDRRSCCLSECPLTPSHHSQSPMCR
ncbi:auxin-responsive protein SAUR71-like [Mangifera indica]|uniref:auxin-responsive protein SAUR71-like n=1 Tax=Mangifera indica TaxID=29780 RepID=UPI001CFB7E7B|nr:auxin-responsive protein SAUR71-like [Mangifera indica]